MLNLGLFRPAKPIHLPEDELKACRRPAERPIQVLTSWILPDEVTDVRKMPNQTMLLGGVVFGGGAHVDLGCGDGGSWRRFGRHATHSANC